MAIGTYSVGVKKFNKIIYIWISNNPLYSLSEFF